MAETQHSNGQASGNTRLASEKIETEKKTFFLDLVENQRGRMYILTEKVHNHRDRILLPAEAGLEFAEALARLVEFERKLG
jgi:hypothetical protein